MANFRWACSATVLLFAGIACLMATLHHSQLRAPRTSFFEMTVPATPRLRKLQTEQQTYSANDIDAEAAHEAIMSTGAQAAQATPVNTEARAAPVNTDGQAAPAVTVNTTVAPKSTDAPAAPAAPVNADALATQASPVDAGVTDAQDAQAIPADTHATLQPVQPPGSVLIMDDHPMQARCNGFTCPGNSTLREKPETIPCSLPDHCTAGDTARCCKGTWAEPEPMPRIDPTVAPRTPLTTPMAPRAPLTTATPKRYLPVFLMHGLGTGTEVFAQLTWLIEQAHPGTVVHAIPLFQGKESFKALETQVETISGYIRAVVLSDPEVYSRGYNMLCYSQGGLICRAIIEYMDDHNVKTFVSMAAPHLGVYGPEFFRQVIKGAFWQRWTLKNVWRIAQSWILQATLSIANMWHDPFHPSWNIKHFLPKYNNMANDPWGNAKRKANFVRLQKAVFLSGHMEGSHWDGGLEPARSGVFEYYKEGSITEFTPMTQQPVYVQDTFGLKTLDEQGKLEVHNPPGVYHGDWVGKPEVALTYIIPHLQ